MLLAVTLLSADTFSVVYAEEIDKSEVNEEKLNGNIIGTVGFTEDGRPALSISGEGVISPDCPKPGNVLTLNYILDQDGQDTSTIKWYKTGSDGKSEITAAQNAEKPIGYRVCWCGYVMDIYTYGLSDEEKAVWAAHAGEHLANGEFTNYSDHAYDADEAAIAASKRLTVTDDLIGYTITAEVTPDIKYEWYEAGSAVETQPTGAVVESGFVPLCNLEFIAGDIPNGTYDHRITKTGFTINADEGTGSGEDKDGRTVTVDADNQTIHGINYTAKLKMGGVGTGDYRSIQFTTDDAEATLKIVCASDDDDNPSRLGIGAVTEGDTGETEGLTDFTGKYRFHDGTETDYEAGGIRIDNHAGISDTKTSTVEADLAANTTYCLYTAEGSGIDFLAVYVTYEGGVSANYYTVKFDANGGTGVAPQRALAGEYYIEPSTTKTGYSMLGWYPSAAHANTGLADTYQFHFNKTKASRNLTLYAGWDKDLTETGDQYEIDMAELRVDSYASTFNHKAFTFVARDDKRLIVNQNNGKVTSVTDDKGAVHTFTKRMNLGGKGAAGSDTDEGTRNISFTIEQEASLTIVLERANTGVSGDERYLVVSNDQGDSYQITVPESGAVMTTLDTKLAPGKWYIYSGNGGIYLYYIKVSFGGDDGGDDEGNTLKFIKEPMLSIVRGTASTENPALEAPREGNVLTLDYTLNLAADVTDASIITWYRAQKGEPGAVVKTGAATTNGIKSYTVTGDDKGYRISVEVTPKDSADNMGTAILKSTGAVREEAEFTTAPTLSSTGSVDAPRPGDVLTVSYKLALEEGETDNSTILWYSGEDEIEAAVDFTAYTVTATDIGKEITVEVMPYVSAAKYGDTVTLVTGTVTDKTQEEPPNPPSTETGLRIIFDDGDVYTYTGAPIKPSITVWNNRDRLVEGTDYTVKYSNNTKASETMNEAGELTAIYAGNQKKWPTVTVTGKGNLGGKVSANFKINPKNFDDARDDKAAANADDIAANKGFLANNAVVLPNKKATPVLLYGGVKLTAKDYKVTAVTGSVDDSRLANATWAEDADNATITLTAKSKGNYTGEVTIPVIVVSPEKQKDARLKAAFVNGKADKTRYYNAKSQIPEIIITNSAGENQLSSDAAEADRKLESGVDYVISYPADTTNVGTKKITVTGISSRCIGTVTLLYSIKPAKKTDASLKAVLIPDAANADGYDFVSTGVTVGDDLKVSYRYKGVTVDTVLTEGVDYKVTYSNNKKAGKNTAAYVVTGLGNYKGLKTDKQYFTIKGIVLSNDNKSEAEGEGIQLIAGDKIYKNKKAVYKSVPSLIVNGELVKASEYTVYYRLDKTGDWSTKPDKIELDEGERFKTVYVKVEPKANKANYISKSGKELTTSYHVVREERKDLSGAKITILDKNGKAARVAYTGDRVKPYKAVIKIKGLEDTTIILDGKDADYKSKGFKVTYANNTLKGKATVVIEATNDNANFVGSKTATFSIVQKSFGTASLIKALLKR